MSAPSGFKRVSPRCRRYADRDGRAGRSARRYLSVAARTQRDLRLLATTTARSAERGSPPSTASVRGRTYTFPLSLNGTFAALARSIRRLRSRQRAEPRCRARRVPGRRARQRGSARCRERSRRMDRGPPRSESTVQRKRTVPDVRGRSRSIADSLARLNVPSSFRQ